MPGQPTVRRGELLERFEEERQLALRDPAARVLDRQLRPGSAGAGGESDPAAGAVVANGVRDEIVEEPVDQAWNPGRQGVPLMIRVGVLAAMFVVAYRLMWDLGFTPDRSKSVRHSTREVIDHGPATCAYGGR